MSEIRLRPIPLALAALLLACGGEESQPAAPAPAEQPASAPKPPPAEAPAATAPAAEAAASGPYACIAGSAERGKVHYAQLCASCHGPNGDGSGPAAAGLNPKPAHHNDGAYMNALDNEHLVKVIAEGGAAVGKSPQMAPWGGALSPAQVLDVVAFVRTLAAPPYACP